MTLKTDEDLADRLLEYADANGKLNEDGVALLSIPGLNVTEVSTAFHIGGKFEARQRAAGLHRWFTVSYDEEIPVSKASDAAFLTEGIEKAEPVEYAQLLVDYPKVTKRAGYVKFEVVNG